MKNVPMQIDPNAIGAQPDLVSSSEVLASGQRVYFRPLRGDQAIELGAYFTGMSQATRRVYGPHPFDQETADGFCAALDSARTLRMLAWIEEEGVERIVAYFVVELGVRAGDLQRYEALGLALHDETDCTLAPFRGRRVPEPRAGQFDDAASVEAVATAGAVAPAVVGRSARGQSPRRPLLH